MAHDSHTTGAPKGRRTRRRQKSSSTRTTTFAELYFGRAAAENEVADDSDRFMATYMDRWNIPDQIARHQRFLLLGPKGAGKSAAAWYVTLRWEHDNGPESVFRTYVDFDELNRTQSPLTSLDKGVISTELTAMTDAAWKLFLGVRVLESLLRDPACDLSRESRAQKLLKDLQAAGLASDDYPKVLRSVRERKGSIGFPKIVNGEISSRDGETLSPGQIGDAILELILIARTPNRHLLAIDGLDKAITQNESYWQTLAALVRVADKVRMRAAQSSANHLYVIVMCRSDVFRRVNFADAPKIAADAGIYIEWGAEAADIKRVRLWEYLARKATVSPDRLFSYLPRSVAIGKGGATETLRYILDFTRYTPRDISLLFSEIQLATSGLKPTGPIVREAADRFASHHLLAEIVAESTGLLPNEVVSRLSNILSAIPKRTFSRSDLQLAISDAGCEGKITTSELGEYLFLQGAIANYRPTVGYYQFYHRRDAYKFDAKGPWALHTGLVYAMNTPWSGT